MVDRDRSHITEKIWSLTLEIIFLLTGEASPRKSGDHMTITVSPPPSLTHERRAMQKIMEVINNITELLTRETESGKTELVMENLGSIEDGSDLKMIKVEWSSCRGTERSPLHDDKAAEETFVRNDEWYKEEESSPVIGAAGQHTWRNFATHSDISPDIVRKTEDDTTEDKMIFRDLHPDCLIAHSLSSPARHWESSPDYLQLVPHHTAQKGGVGSHCIGEKLYSCSECGKCFSFKSGLLRHGRIHTGEKPYSCSECGKCFSQRSLLNIHERVHTGEKPFSCSDCGKCFYNKSALLKHKKVHTGEKPFFCSECGKCFTRKLDLMRHERVHTGEKPYFCSECRKCFNRKSSFLIHGRVHTGEKPYSCCECGKCFSHKSVLMKHASVHTGEKPYSCSECKKCFTRKSTFMEHERLHTGEKPFSCFECGKCFSHKSVLNKHKRVHTGEKPYSCSECGKCFTRKSGRRKHDRLHSEGKLYC
ncbi:uncharacterized protein PAF06_007269 [Gastrophryne carolinensis]